MERERPIAVSRATIRKRSGDCGTMLVDSLAVREMSGFPALMVEVNQELMKRHHRLSGHERLVLVGLGCLKIFFC